MSPGLSEEDVEVIREGYRLFRAGDPAFLDRYESDARMVFPECLAAGGAYASPWEAIAFFNSAGELFEGAQPEPEEFIRDGDRLVVLGHFHGRARATGEQVSIRFAHVFGLTGSDDPMSENRYSSFELVIDTAAVLAAIGANGAS
jgi:hypothetical protein